MRSKRSQTQSTVWFHLQKYGRLSELKQSGVRKEEAETTGGHEETLGTLRNVLLMSFDFTKSHRSMHMQWTNVRMCKLFLKKTYLKVENYAGPNLLPRFPDLLNCDPFVELCVSQRPSALNCQEGPFCLLP